MSEKKKTKKQCKPRIRTSSLPCSNWISIDGLGDKRPSLIDFNIVQLTYFKMGLSIHNAAKMSLVTNTWCICIKKKIQGWVFIDQYKVNRKYSEVFMRVSYKLWGSLVLQSNYRTVPTLLLAHSLRFFTHRPQLNCLYTAIFKSKTISGDRLLSYWPSCVTMLFIKCSSKGPTMSEIWQPHFVLCSFGCNTPVQLLQGASFVIQRYF